MRGEQLGGTIVAENQPVYQAAGAMLRFLLTPTSDGAQEAKDRAFRGLTLGEGVSAVELASDLWKTRKEQQGEII